MLLVLASLLSSYADINPLLRIYGTVCTTVLFVMNWAVISEDLVHGKSRWHQAWIRGCSDRIFDRDRNPYPGEPEHGAWQQGHDTESLWSEHKQDISHRR